MPRLAPSWGTAAEPFAIAPQLAGDDAACPFTAAAPPPMRQRALRIIWLVGKLPVVQLVAALAGLAVWALY